jgi:hypothetical protein
VREGKIFQNEFKNNQKINDIIRTNTKKSSTLNLSKLMDRMRSQERRRDYFFDKKTN